MSRFDAFLHDPVVELPNFAQLLFEDEEPRPRLKLPGSAAAADAVSPIAAPSVPARRRVTRPRDADEDEEKAERDYEEARAQQRKRGGRPGPADPMASTRSRHVEAFLRKERRGRRGLLDPDAVRYRYAQQRAEAARRNHPHLDPAEALRDFNDDVFGSAASTTEEEADSEEEEEEKKRHDDWMESDSEEEDDELEMKVDAASLAETMLKDLLKAESEAEAREEVHTRADLSTDRLRDIRRCAGDLIVDRMRAMLNSLGLVRSTHQKQFHEYFLRAILPLYVWRRVRVVCVGVGV